MPITTYFGLGTSFSPICNGCDTAYQRRKMVQLLWNLGYLQHPEDPAQDSFSSLLAWLPEEVLEEILERINFCDYFDVINELPDPTERLSYTSPPDSLEDYPDTPKFTENLK